MSFGREKRLWLAVLALLAPIPLPFNQVLEWPFFFVYTLFVIHFLQRAERGAWITLSNTALNLLGLVSIPFIAMDIHSAISRNSVVTALTHLLMFLLVVKLFSIRREKDKWHIMAAIYFLFVGAMATSSHVTIAPYLLAFLILSLLVLGRFAHLHVAAPFGRDEPPATSPPFRAPLALGTLIVVLLAIPLFASMPRIREPYLMGRGTGSGGMARTTGFSDSVDLSLTTSIRSNRNVAMRVQFDDQTQLGNASELRFKGAAYDRYQKRNWFRAQRRPEVLVPRTNSSFRVFELADATPISSAEVFLQPGSSSSLLLPVEAISVKLDIETALGRDSGGAVLLPFQPRDPIKYHVTLAAKPVIVARLADDPESALSALDRSGLTPRMAELAQQVMGGQDEAGETEALEGDAGADNQATAQDEALPPGDGEPIGILPAGERIDLLEQHLLTQYEYTLDFLGRSGESPLEDFLFVYKSGHCEFFASAMVLMLRSQGIPARLITGFLGAELNPIEGYYVVRQQNAHAWVEAYAPERGWQVYDPTPPDGRPTVATQSLSLLMTQIYDYMTFRWDRYVLTYGADDQGSFFRKMRERMRLLWGQLKDMSEEEPATPPASFTAEVATGEAPTAPSIWQSRTSLPILLVIFALAVATLVAWNRRRALNGQTAYLRLRHRLERAGLEISDSLAPLDLLDRAVERFPPASDALRLVVGHYVHESFAGRELAERERLGLRDALRSVEEALAEDHRQRRRERRAA